MERIETTSGVVLVVNARNLGPVTEVILEKERGPDCLLHWGLQRAERTPWQAPPGSAWPDGSVQAGGAVRTPWVIIDGRPRIVLQLQAAWRFRFLEFALFDPKTSHWDNNSRRNYRVSLPLAEQPGPSPLQAARESSDPGAVTYERVYVLEQGCELAVVVRSSEPHEEVSLVTDLAGAVWLRWGFAGADRQAWCRPDSSVVPRGTVEADEGAVESPLFEGNGLRQVRLRISREQLRGGLCFVLVQYDPSHQRPQRWWKDGHRDFCLPLQPTRAPQLLQEPATARIAEEIIDHETGESSWSLMHRFHLARALLERLPSESSEGLALLFLWLRFSSIRQLDWQRNYNTKPSELANAQDRLTRHLGERYAAAGPTRPWLRAMATTLGRGGERGQRVRDAILEIMHRHHIKEVAGHFLEEWHQKLHNNTTPDDVLICEAYLEFLRQSGNRAVFYSTLAAGGVSRERLASYERPIRSEPDFVPNLRDALLHDFGEFLGVLRSVHAAADLGIAVQTTRGLLDQPVRGLLDALWQRRDEPAAQTWVLETITHLREALAARLVPGCQEPRELLYLDLALEDLLRRTVERNLHRGLTPDELLNWTELAVRNLHISRPTEDLSLGLRHMQRLWRLPRFGHDWVLHAQAVLDRLQRELVAIVDGDAHFLQPLAEYLGPALGVAAWAVDLFSEEVVRGRVDFAVSALLRKVTDLLHRIEGSGPWQIVSPGNGNAVGRVQVSSSSASDLGPGFDVRTILITDRIRGEEDIPARVSAVLSGGSVDLLSHVAVRARNAGVLMATCRDESMLSDLRGRRGDWIRLRINAAGEVIPEDALLAKDEPEKPPRRHTLTAPARGSELALTSASFRADKVGPKSLNLQRLRTRVPDWIRTPASVTLPFGVCEHVVADSINQAVAQEIRDLSERLATAERAGVPALLAGLRAAFTRLASPRNVEEAVRATMSTAGLPPPEPWDEAWRCVTRVWASKWNDRAYRSRETSGISHASLVMAVLVQEVIASEYAFVVHTVNPITGDPNELYGELVPGLGETLVGGEPGRALGFSLRRGNHVPCIASYPSKSLALRGNGLIFRSDSNGEDQMGLAGAGLYESVALPSLEPWRIDYTQTELLWSKPLQDRILTSIAEVGAAVEAALGGPQDIEGVYADGRFYVVQARPQVGLQRPPPID